METQKQQPPAVVVQGTLFSDQYAYELANTLVSFEELVVTVDAEPVASKETLPWIKLARMSGKTNGEVTGKISSKTGKPSPSLRFDKGVVALTGAECDYDGPPPGHETVSIEEARDLLEAAGVEAWLYTSASHTEAEPRYRILLPFAAEYTADTDTMRAYRKAAVLAAESALGTLFASESYVLSQAYYYGPVKGRDYKMLRAAGRCVDEVEDLHAMVPALLEATRDERPGDDGRPPFDFADTVAKVVSGENYHQSLVSLSGHCASKGMPKETCVKVLESMMLASAGDDRWQERFDDITRTVDDIYAKEDFKHPPERPVFRKEGIGFEATFGAKTPKTVPFVIAGILPKSSFGIAGAGGSMKSTTMLRIMMHVVLGKDVFDCKVLEPGPCVYVTSEDEIDTVRHRVRMMADAMGLTSEERSKLARELLVEDVNGSIARLVEQDSKGNLRYSERVDELLALYKDAPLAVMCFDPMIYFGPGETFVNDGPAMLMNLCRKFSKELQCAAGFLHHTGQDAARNKTDDQYAGRGGTAFADNARMVGVMTPAKPGDKKHPVPEEIADAWRVNAGAQVTLLHIPKVSYAKAPTQPVWIFRYPDDPWRFLDVWGEADDTASKEQHEEQELKNRMTILTAIYRHLVLETNEGRYPNRTSVRENLLVEVQAKKVGKNRMGGFIELGLQHGFIVEVDLPEELRMGARQRYLKPGTEPYIGGGGLTLPVRDPAPGE